MQRHRDGRRSSLAERHPEGGLSEPAESVGGDGLSFEGRLALRICRRKCVLVDGVCVVASSRLEDRCRGMLRVRWCRKAAIAWRRVARSEWSAVVCFNFFCSAGDGCNRVARSPAPTRRYRRVASSRVASPSFPGERPPVGPSRGSVLRLVVLIGPFYRSPDTRGVHRTAAVGLPAAQRRRVSVRARGGANRRRVAKCRQSVDRDRERVGSVGVGGLPRRKAPGGSPAAECAGEVSVVVSLRRSHGARSARRKVTARPPRPAHGTRLPG